MDPRLTARKRLRILLAALVGLVVVCLLAIPVWNAAAHYSGGVRALDVSAYDKAADEFAAARILFIPYRDAQGLEAQARRSSREEAATVRRQAEAVQAAVVTQFAKAGDKLNANDADGALIALQAIAAGDLKAALAGNPKVRESADALAKNLAAASGRALEDGAWQRAGRFADALLVLQPSSKLAATLESRARTGQVLGAKVDTAEKAARLGKWRMALRLALSVVAVQKNFPGAAAVVADARDAIARQEAAARAARAARAAAAAAAAAPTYRAPSTPTITQPPPP